MADGTTPTPTPSTSGSNPLPLSNPSAGGTTTPSSTTPTSTTPASPTPEWMNRIPEQHRANPGAYLEELEGLRAWADYGRGMAPHHQTFESVRNDWQAFQDWRRGKGAQPQPQPMPGPATPDDENDDDIDYGDPEQVRKALRGLRQQVKGHVETFTGEVSKLRGEQEQGQNTLFEFVRIQQELRDLQNEELYGHTKFQPTVKPQELAKFMLDNNINDAHKAYELLYGRPRLESQVKSLEAKAQEMYQQGKSDAEQELANRRVTTETSSGTPWRVRTGEGRSAHPANSVERRQEILDRMTAQLNVPREQAS